MVLEMHSSNGGNTLNQVLMGFAAPLTDSLFSCTVDWTTDKPCWEDSSGVVVVWIGEYSGDWFQSLFVNDTDFLYYECHSQPIEAAQSTTKAEAEEDTYDQWFWCPAGTSSCPTVESIRILRQPLKSHGEGHPRTCLGFHSVCRREMVTVTGLFVH